MKLNEFFDKISNYDISNDLKEYIPKYNISTDNSECPLFKNLLLQKYEDAKHEKITKNNTKLRSY